MHTYASPTTLTEALSLRLRGARILAGGTDLYPNAAHQLAGPILDISRIAALSGISRQKGALHIGAGTSWAVLATADVPPALLALQQAARMVGGRQIQTMGSIGGNLCNASPAADGIPPLLAARAEVELASERGIRRLALASFLIGPRQTALRPDEILTTIVIPEQGLAGRSAFLKLGARAHLVISIAMVAVRVVIENGRVSDAALAVGACSAVARRLPKVEAALIGQATADAARCITDADVAASLAPLDDIRATAAYRNDAAAELLRRAFAQATA